MKVDKLFFDSVEHIYITYIYIFKLPSLHDLISHFKELKRLCQGFKEEMN